MQGLVASVLLLAGGLQALQTAAIASAMPFLLVMLLICFGLFKALQDDWLKINSVQLHTTSVQYARTSVSWEDRIDVLVSHPSYEQARRFVDNVATPALSKVSQGFLSRGINADLQYDEDRVRLVIENEEVQTFVYGLRIRAFTLPVTHQTQEEGEDESQNNYFRVEVFLEHGGQYYDVMGYTEEQIQADVVTQYEKYLHYLHLSSAEYVEGH